MIARAGTAQAKLNKTRRSRASLFLFSTYIHTYLVPNYKTSYRANHTRVNCKFKFSSANYFSHYYTTEMHATLLRRHLIPSLAASLLSCSTNMLNASDGEAFSIALFRHAPWVASCSRHNLCCCVKEKSRNMMMLCGMKVGRLYRILRM